MTNKSIDEKNMNKVSGGYPGARFIVIDFNIKCKYCGYYGKMTYEEGTETSSDRSVYAYCPDCKNTTLVKLGTL